MRTTRRWLSLALASLLGACVSIEEAPMASRAIAQGQRVLMVVYAAPGPIVGMEDNKAETAAKIIPGLGLMVKDSQDERDLKASRDLQQYLPPWDPAMAFDSSFRKQVLALGQPGRVIAAADTEIPADAWGRLNAASDVLDWQRRYCIERPGTTGVSRNYANFLTLDDALVLEVNLLYGVNDTEGDALTFAPSLKAVAKLSRANTMHQLWRHEDLVLDRAGTRALYDFKLKPSELLAAWQRLMPALSAQLADSLRKNLLAGGVPLNGAAPVSTGPASVLLLSGPGWAPAPPAVATSSDAVVGSH